MLQTIIKLVPKLMLFVLCEQQDGGMSYLELL